MKPDRLTEPLTMTAQIVISLIMCIIVLPFFILWRLPISLLYFTKKEPEEKKNGDQEREKDEAKEGEQRGEAEEKKEPEPKPPLDLHDRALAPYTKQWTSFKNLSINKPLITHWSRIVCSTLLITQTILSLALLEKSLIYHIPWFVKHLSNTQYKTERKKLWLNDLLLHVAGLVVTCMPLLGLLGIGLGILYYVRKALVYGKFRKDMIQKKGGRGYEKPDDEEEGGGGKNGEGHGVKGVIMGVMEHVLHPHVPQSHLHHPHAEYEQRQQENPPYGYPGYSEDILFEQPGDAMYGHQDTVQQQQPPPPPVKVQPPKPAALLKNPYTLAGIQSIWTGNKEKLKTGYDGREIRKRNFANDVEMADRAGRK